MVKMEANGSSAAKAAGATLKPTGNGGKKPPTRPARQRDTFRPAPSISSEGRNYGMFSEGSSNAPYAGFRSQGDTKPCEGKDDRSTIEDEGEEEICPSDELVKLMMQEVATYRKSMKRDRRCMMCPFREFQGPRRVKTTSRTTMRAEIAGAHPAGSSSGYV